VNESVVVLRSEAGDLIREARSRLRDVAYKERSTPRELLPCEIRCTGSLIRAETGPRRQLPKQRLPQPRKLRVPARWDKVADKFILPSLPLRVVRKGKLLSPSLRGDLRDCSIRSRQSAGQCWQCCLDEVLQPLVLKEFRTKAGQR